jgi:methionyl-tRNA formyltransferase
LIENGDVVTTKQPQSTELKDAPKLTSENTKIDWTWPLQKIDAFIRGLSPYPVAWSLLSVEGEANSKVKIYAADLEEEDHNHPPGSIITTKKEMKVAAAGGYINIKLIQLPGKRKMEVSALLNGHSFGKSAKLL